MAYKKIARAEIAYWIWKLEQENTSLLESTDWVLLKTQIENVRNIAREQGCPNWGKKENGHFGSCGYCDYCIEFQND